MDKNQLEQEKEVRELLRRADRHADKTGTLRRETLKRLIDLAHSPSPVLKSLVAGNLKYYIKDFPDLEDDAINAVYDLCEDPVSKIRIEGYNAIVQVSREQRKWIKRNADVLVQLLQSDEPDEVVVVKKALLEHLDMDPRVTLGVLCDQVVPHDEPMDEEEQAIRDHLRSLVLAFITGEAKRAIIERHASNHDAETVLVGGLLKAISKLPYTDATIIVKDILVSLPSYRSSPSRGDELLQAILTRTRSALAEELRSGAHPILLETTRQYLDLAALITVQRRIAPPPHLVRFYCTALINKVTLSKLHNNAQMSVIYNLADALHACVDGGRPDDTFSGEIPSVRKQVVDASVILFERLAESGLQDIRSWEASRTFLKACVNRQQETGWTVPTHMAIWLRKILDIADQQNEEMKVESVQDVQNLIRSLLPPTKPILTQSVSDTNVLQGKSARNTVSINIAKRKNEDRLVVPPPRPATATPLIRNQRGGHMIVAAGHIAGSNNRRSDIRGFERPPPSASGQLSTVRTDVELHPRKRARRDDGDNDTPSLLSRMNSSMSNGPARTIHTLPPTPGVAIQRGAVVRPSAEPHRSPIGGYSIKGAAKAVNRDQPSHFSPPVRSSLLDRMAGGSDSLADRIEGGETGNRKKKRKGKQ